MAITYGNIRHPGYIDRYIAEKRQGFGWDDLGQRDVKWVTLHRMLGTLWGTDGYFRNPSVSSITDYGVGVAATDGKDNAGIILRWNDPLGRRSGWASGPVSNPFGDGAAAVAKYGVNGVNRFGVSLEISGQQNTPIDDFAWGEIVHFIAYWADYAKVPWTNFPLNPHTGFSFVIWHTEFCRGTGKECPFKWVRDNTNRLIADVKAYLKRYQEGEAKPEPAPTPKQRTFTLRFETPIRTSPGFWDYDNNKSNVIKTLPAGTKGRVKDGPKKADGIDFYDLDIDGFGSGWVQDTVLHTLDIRDS